MLIQQPDDSKPERNAISTLPQSLLLDSDSITVQVSASMHPHSCDIHSATYELILLGPK